MSQLRTARTLLAQAAGRVEATTVAGLLSLPEPVQRVLAGPPVVRDGQRLSVETQLLLRLQRLARIPGAETLPVPQGREAVLRHSRLTGGRLPVGAVRDLEVAGLRARLYVPRSAVHSDAVTPGLVFLHGGGFVFGDLASHDGSCRLLAERAGVRVLAVDYRLGPEEPFPAAYDDALAAYTWVLEHTEELRIDRDRLAVGGDSAGGNLSAGVAIEAARRGLPLAWQLLVYPATDCTRDTRSLRLFGQGFYLTQEFMDLAHRSYLPPDLDRRDPRVSPLFAELPDGLAPAYVVTAGFDPLRDEGEAYARKLADAGVPVELQRFPDQIHGFFNIVGVGRGSRQANLEIAARLRAALHGSGVPAR